jgi:hypothetical protein
MNNTPLPDFLDIFKLTTERLLAQKMLTEVEYGRVTAVNPLEITLDSKTRLPAAFLTLTNAVKDHSVDITVSWATVEDDYLEPDHTHGKGNNGAPTDNPINWDTTHKHDIKGRKRIKIHNGLTLGERVILLRKGGGQDYIVLDRVDEAQTSGESL